MKGKCGRVSILEQTTWVQIDGFTTYNVGDH